MMMGTDGFIFRMTFRAARPSISGISMSKVIRSGAYCSRAMMAAFPFSAVPTTRKPADFVMAFTITRRVMSESSTTKILIGCSPSVMTSLAQCPSWRRCLHTAIFLDLAVAKFLASTHRPRRLNGRQSFRVRAQVARPVIGP